MLELIQRCRRMNAGVLTQVYSDDADEPICAVIVVDGTAAVKEVMAAVDGVITTWHAPVKKASAT